VNAELQDKILIRNSSMFILNIPEINRFEKPSGPTEAVEDGYYLILKPLNTGKHVLKYKIIHEQNSLGADLTYIQGDVIYFFNVK
jgi:hypothetical protein